MDTISIIARRLKDGQVQYGWSGNGGRCELVGKKLLKWYNTKDSVDYLFGLGQLSFLGAPESENCEFPMMMTHGRTGYDHRLANSEQGIFDKDLYPDYVYFYDLDKQWYYVYMNFLRVKMPLKLVMNNIGAISEVEFGERVSRKLLQYILDDYYYKDEKFQKFISEYDLQEIKNVVNGSKWPMDKLMEEYHLVCHYFDDWIVVCTDDDERNVTGFIIRPKREEHVETIEWIKEWERDEKIRKIEKDQRAAGEKRGFEKTLEILEDIDKKRSIDDIAKERNVSRQIVEELLRKVSSMAL